MSTDTLDFRANCAFSAGWHKAYRDVHMEAARAATYPERRRMFVELARGRQRLFLSNLTLTRKYEGNK